MPRRGLWDLIGLLGSLCGLVALLATPLARAAADAPAGENVDAAEGDNVSAIVASEEIILTLTPLLADLDRSAMNLRLPDHNSERLFYTEVRFTELSHTTPPQAVAVPHNPLAERRSWTIDAVSLVAKRPKLDLWRPLFDPVEYFAHAHFYFVKGEFAGTLRARWNAEVGFDALARTREGGWRSIRARVDTVWRKVAVSPGGPPTAWRILQWSISNLETMDEDAPLFAETLDTALPDLEVRSRARHSIHEGFLLDLARDRENFEKPHKWFRIKPTDFQPGISVVDIDRDGWDDLYVMDRWGENLLLRNRGDGTFEEVAAELGLAVENHSSSAIFADFDNDGDSDVFIGRTLQPSLYFVNENGHFEDHSAKVVEGGLPALVTSISAADVNGDGLLDVYFSTYAAELLEVQRNERRSRSQLGKLNEKPLLSEFLPIGQALEVERRYAQTDPYLGRAGPPNVLLLNRGDNQFERVATGDPISVWRNTFQSTWADYDGDGDPDLYIANDFSTNNFLRNDGEGRFTDITAATGTADIGFGMGASWGDYDNDGRQDLYVSNMFSKAGQRITASVEGLNPRLAQMSRGNSLFRNTGEAFDKVSGLSEPALQVEKAGWSWGGQFVDVDNDGYLDLYAGSGFYTAPRQIAIKGADS